MNITYLFGAGASANALPIVFNFNERLELFIQAYSGQRVNYNSNEQERLTLFIQDAKEILAESKKHSTIDTLAKKYFHSYKTRGKDLKKLKRVLTTFFIYEQLNEGIHQSMVNPLIKESKKGIIDMRYDSLIASLLKPKQDEIEFPSNVNILTWNYDFQFELAMKNFFPDLNLLNIQQKLRVYPIIDEISLPDYWKQLSENRFRILHLNGQAHFYIKDDKNEYKSVFETKKADNDKETPMKQSMVTDSSFISLTFSWERRANESIQYQEIQKIIEEAKKIIRDSQVLVVIGYSFPFFNREVDKEIFKNHTFDKVYFQDSKAQERIDLFKTTFKRAYGANDFIPYSNIDQFLIPPELD